MSAWMFRLSLPGDEDEDECFDAQQMLFMMEVRCFSLPDSFGQKQLNEDDLQDGLHQVEYAVHDVKPARDVFHIVGGKDADGDGEAGVEHDEEDAHLEKEPADRKVEDADVKIKGAATCPSRQAPAWTCPPGANWLSVQAAQLLFRSSLSLR